ELVAIGHQRAVVLGIHHTVIVGVVAGIANAIVVAVGLGRIGHRRAVVDDVEDAVTIGVGRATAILRWIGGAGAIGAGAAGATARQRQTAQRQQGDQQNSGI